MKPLLTILLLTFTTTVASGNWECKVYGMQKGEETILMGRSNTPISMFYGDIETCIDWR